MVSGNAFTERERERARKRVHERREGEREWEKEERERGKKIKRDLLEILFSFDTIISCSAQHTILLYQTTNIPTFYRPQEF